MPSHPHQLQTIVIGDDPEAWAEAGFAIEGDRFRVANTVIQLCGSDDARGILRATADGIATTIDGMPFGDAATHVLPAAEHPNQTVALDHLVAMSPNMDRTTQALVDAGLDHRRTRTFEAGGNTMRQAFFWLGDVILELAGDDAGHGVDPATLWGLALTCRNLDDAAHHLGERLGTIKPAVQRGRQIATMRTDDLGISIPIALMSPHPEEES